MAGRSISRRRAARRKRIPCPEITRYLRRVETGKVAACERQRKFAAYVRRVFAEEELIIDRDRLAAYLDQLQHFPYDEFYDWEQLLLTLWLCVFNKDGTPRWPDLVCFIGRGAGKNGFIAFTTWCMVSKINGIPHYDVDICANSEEQAKMSFMDIHDILEGEHRVQWKKRWRWNLDQITNMATGSTVKYRTNSPKSKDGLRSGAVIFDEVHGYQNWKNLTVFTTGLGKKPHPRRAFISSNGDVRDGVYDRLLARCDAILDGDIADNGYLPFVCSLDDESEVHDEANWPKANPTLPYKPELLAEMRKEYADWLFDPAENADFMTKRMGIPQGDKESEVTTWENLVAASEPLPDLAGCPCVLGIDFARTSDFISAVLLFRKDRRYYALHHSWFCTSSRDAARIRVPLAEWEKAGLVTIVDDVEVHPSLVTSWVAAMARIYWIERAAIDDYRYTLMKNELSEIGFEASRGEVYRVRPSDHMRVAPLINSVFANHLMTWGDDPAMRWFTHNVKVVPWQNGNYKYEKIEPRGRKTDGFMALVAAFCIEDSIPEESAGFDELPAVIM